MNEDAVRALVRQVLARHADEPADRAARPPLPLPRHVSHYRYALTKTDGPCLIEPSVQCNHCGYCEAHGH